MNRQFGQWRLDIRMLALKERYPFYEPPQRMIKIGQTALIGLEAWTRHRGEPFDREAVIKYVFHAMPAVRRGHQGDPVFRLAIIDAAGSDRDFNDVMWEILALVVEFLEN